MYVGTATGSLLIPFLALDDIERIKKIYTSIRQDDIFSVCPFIIKKKNGVIRTRINPFGIIKQFIKGEKTFGNSTNLKNLILTNFTKEDFGKIRLSGKEIIVTVANLTKQTVEYKSSNDYEYNDFCGFGLRQI